MTDKCKKSSEKLMRKIMGVLILEGLESEKSRLVFPERDREHFLKTLQSAVKGYSQKKEEVMLIVKSSELDNRHSFILNKGYPREDKAIFVQERRVLGTEVKIFSLNIRKIKEVKFVILS